MSDTMIDAITGQTEGEGPTFSEMFSEMRDWNAGVARVIPSGEFDLPIGGLFFFRGKPDDVAALREAAESVARAQDVHIEPGEGDIPWGSAIHVCKCSGFDFVVTAAEYDEERTCSIVTVGPELTTAVRDAVDAVEAIWEAEYEASLGA